MELRTIAVFQIFNFFSLTESMQINSRCSCLILESRKWIALLEIKVESNFHAGDDLCMGGCINTPGSYMCNCPPGYEIQKDAKTCKGNSAILNQSFSADSNA